MRDEAHTCTLRWPYTRGTVSKRRICVCPDPESGDPSDSTLGPRRYVRLLLGTEGESCGKRNPIGVKRIAIVLLACLTALGPTSPGTADEVCTRTDVKRVVQRFIRAYNSGHFKTLNRVIAREPEFRWFRIMPLERDYPASDDRDSLIPYFKERHRLKDQLRLLSLKIGKERAQSGGYYFSPRYIRTSDDPNPLADAEFAGKGEVTSKCEIFVWTVSRQV